MIKALTALACGMLFGLGLALSGMLNPSIVQGFLDIGGAWNPALAGVMAGAIPVAFLFYRRAGDRVPPPSSRIDRRLVLGALLFGLGWGLVGICPGPALAAWLVNGRALIFIAAMLAGMGLYRLVPSP